MNLSKQEKSFVYALMGPTGSGKTEMAAGLDSSLIEVVSCDSRQVYSELDIGTAYPEEQILERMPHHCTGFLKPDEPVNAAIYVENAKRAIQDIQNRGKIPLIVGGTGFYYTALKTGLFQAPSDPELRRELSQKSIEEKREMLQAMDPAGAERIHINDVYRTERALEITIGSGKPWSEHRARSENGLEWDHVFQGIRLEVDRTRYRERLRERAGKMIQQGFIEEAKRVYEKYGDCPGLRSLGYEAALQAAKGKIHPSDLKEEIAKAHYQYGKKQMTWFRREKELRVSTAEQGALAIRGIIEGSGFF